MSETAFNERAREEKKGGKIVFVAIFLGPFIGGAAAWLARSGIVTPVWAPIAGLALVHWVVVSQFVLRTAPRAGRVGQMLLWSVVAVVADFMWFGVLMTLAAAAAGAG